MGFTLLSSITDSVQHNRTASSLRLFEDLYLQRLLSSQQMPWLSLSRPFYFV
ncbi:hypothetical protein RchiOBHm_Chr4g0391511 [Rosa chinensis]|uniref:Uncharacterized protein n=1 Tax=Rosa chinensis TaxID=74649 RepID=A0A2P6QQI2_ROSCH|nr:hypothetical protein RchiOBHm_Chr4g0391511 [Rosa chinensis]